MSWDERKRAIDNSVLHSTCRTEAIRFHLVHAIHNGDVRATEYLLDLGADAYAAWFWAVYDSSDSSIRDALIRRGVFPTHQNISELVKHRSVYTETSIPVLVRYGAPITPQILQDIPPRLQEMAAMLRAVYRRRWTLDNHSLWALPVQRQIVTLLVVSKRDAAFRKLSGRLLAHLFALIANSFYPEE